MSILKLASDAGRTVEAPAPRQRSDRELVLPAITLAHYVDLGTRFDEAGFIMLVRATEDARRYAAMLSAKMPMTDRDGEPPVWTVVGDVLGRILPVAGSMIELEDVAMGLRTIVRATLDGEDCTGMMGMSCGMLSINADAVDASISLNLLEGRAEMTMRFEIHAHGAQLID